MARTPDVIPGEPVESAWGNEIRDRTIQRFADATERDLEIQIPVDGDCAFLEDSGQFMVYAGSSWGNILIAASGGAGAPSFAFEVEPGLGWYRGGAARIHLAANGGRVFSISNGAMIVGDVVSGNALIPTDGPGTVDAPTYSFQGNAQLGHYRKANNQIAVVMNGEEIAFWGVNGTFITKHSTNGSAPNVYMQASDGRLFRSTAIVAATDAPGVVSMDARTGLTSGDSVDLADLVGHLLDRIEALEAAI